jgi:hypothetical protein
MSLPHTLEHLDGAHLLQNSGRSLDMKINTTVIDSASRPTKLKATGPLGTSSLRHSKGFTSVVGIKRRTIGSQLDGLSLA